MAFLHVYYCFYNIFELIKQLAQCDLATNRSFLAGKNETNLFAEFFIFEG